MDKNRTIKYLRFIFTVLILTILSKAYCQNKQPLETSQELLDSLSKFPQGTMENDLYYKLFLDKYPNTQEAYMSRSVSYNKRGDNAVAFAMLNKAVELNPIQNLGYRAFVKLYMMHDYDGALNDCLQLDSLASNSKPAVWGEDMDQVIGLCYLQINDYKNAKLYLNNSISRITKRNGKKWNSPRTFLYLGISLLKDKLYKQAIEVFDELIGLNPNYSEAYYYKAKSYYEQSDVINAKNSLQECKRKFEKYGIEKNAYFEMPYQIYFSMLSDLSNLK